jgi:anaerobic glycerol-3-phosphate dehydrogenase
LWCYIRTLYMPPLISHFTEYSSMILCYSDPWICNLCNNFNFSESFFDTSLDLSHSLHENSKVDEDIFDELRQLKRKHPKKCICVCMVSLISHMQQFLRRTLLDQHAKSDNCLLEIVHLGIGRQFWFQPRIAYQLYLMLIIS